MAKKAKTSVPKVKQSQLQNPRQLGLIPAQNRTDEENRIYAVYVTARECLTNSLEKVREALDLSKEEFYSKLDCDAAFQRAIVDGFSDSRAMRLAELESTLISLALGYEYVEQKAVAVDGEVEVVDIRKKCVPNLSALQILLERYEGSSWSIKQRVVVESGSDPREIDYKILSTAQLKALAKSEEDK